MAETYKPIRFLKNAEQAENLVIVFQYFNKAQRSMITESYLLPGKKHVQLDIIEKAEEKTTLHDMRAYIHYHQCIEWDFLTADDLIHPGRVRPINVEETDIEATQVSDHGWEICGEFHENSGFEGMLLKKNNLEPYTNDHHVDHFDGCPPAKKLNALLNENKIASFTLPEHPGVFIAAAAYINA